MTLVQKPGLLLQVSDSWVHEPDFRTVNQHTRWDFLSMNYSHTSICLAFCRGGEKLYGLKG